METPILTQYYRIKSEHHGEVLFFRLGDFYEMFAEDAIEISALLNLTLTARNGLPMCGIPYHASKAYIARLLKHGKKIAICEQMSDTGKGKGIIERKVVEVITPGTAIDEDFLDGGASNYLAALWAGAKEAAFSYIDLSTGAFYATAFPAEEAASGFIQAELERLQLKEIVVQESLVTGAGQDAAPLSAALFSAVQSRPSLVIDRWMDWQFDKERCWRRLSRQFGVPRLRGLGLNEDGGAVIAAGVLLDYIDTTAGSLLGHIRSLTLYGYSEFAGIDASSQRNLELTRNLNDGGVQYSLLETLDETKTGMGRRLLVNRLLHPLLSKEMIEKRLEMTGVFYHNQSLLSELRALLVKTQDLERLCSRLAMDRAHGKDLAMAKNALSQFFLINSTVKDRNLPYETRNASSIDEAALKALLDLRDLLDKALLDEPSTLLTEGKLIKRGFNAELDRLHALREDGRRLLSEYLEEERAATDISSLKISYNRIIGYYFEVTNAQMSKVPPYFIRRQSVVTGGRFTTDKLSALESDINGAYDKIIESEKRLFLELREKTKERITEISQAAARIAELDVAASSAQAATVHCWVKPVITEDNSLYVLEGRHPVVEAHLPRREFVPNDTALGGGFPSFILITGPNMAGKSTYLRQCALFVVMAQMGSFVPAAEARIGLCDKIYCRVGAQDNLARGESTFLVEMNETAYILNTATERSLVIMDEVGRGTGTNDGRAIAQAVTEDMLNRIKCRALFATHYHELAMLKHPALANRYMDIEEISGKILFKRRLREGASLQSYGIHVARMAGLPESVLKRAEEIEAELSKTQKAAPPPAPKKNTKVNEEKLLFW